MVSPKNVAELAALKDKFKDSSSIFLTEYRGLTIGQLQELRGELARRFARLRTG